MVPYSVLQWGHRLSAMETNLPGSAMVLWSGRLNPLTQIHKSTFLPFQPAPTLILSVDSGLAVSGGQSGASVPEVEASIRMLQFVLPGVHKEHATAGAAVRAGPPAGCGGATEVVVGHVAILAGPQV